MEKKFDFLPYSGALSFNCFLSENSLGRRLPIVGADDDASYIGAFDPFFIDKEKIRLSKSLRRLDDKTQVFIDHRSNPHIRNRRSHTDEVVSIAVYIAKILGLNVYLVEAIALGHDIGHSPFGHLGERAIRDFSGRNFEHCIMSVVVSQFIERNGKGLNLSWEVLEGIANHSRGIGGLQINPNLPLEYAVVMLADKIAYVFSDLNDALRCGYFKENDLPSEFFELGKNQRERWNNCIFNLVKESAEKMTVSFLDSDVAQKFSYLRDWSFNNFYLKLDKEFQRESVYEDFKLVYPKLNKRLEGINQDVSLPIALMTDSEFRKIAQTLKKDKKKFLAPDYFNNFGFYEIVSNLPKDSKIDICNAGLNKSKFQNFNAW